MRLLSSRPNNLGGLTRQNCYREQAVTSIDFDGSDIRSDRRRSQFRKCEFLSITTFKDHTRNILSQFQLTRQVSCVHKEQLHVTMQNRPYLYPFRAAAVSSRLALLLFRMVVRDSNVFSFQIIILIVPKHICLLRDCLFPITLIFECLIMSREFPRLGSFFDIGFPMKHQCYLAISFMFSTVR